MNLLQSSWFQIQNNAVSVKFIELSLSWRTQAYTTEQSQLQLQTVHGSLNHVV